MPVVIARPSPTRGVVIEVEAGQQIELEPVSQAPRQRITVTLEHKSGRHARLRVVADEYQIGRPKKAQT